MTGVVKVLVKGRECFSERYSFRDDRERIFAHVADHFDPPYEMAVIPDVSAEVEKLHCSNIQGQLSQRGY